MFGAQSGTSYPYHTSKDSYLFACQYNPWSVVAKPTGSYFVGLFPSDQDLKNALASGPAVVLIDSTNSGSYSSGIFDGYCSDALIRDHYVLAVGWDVDQASGTEYWIIRNSWGTSWGENGYMRVKIDGNCNIKLDSIAYF